MPSKEAKRKELEAQYKAHLQEIEDAEEDAEGDDDEDDIIILRGNARKSFLEGMKNAGYTLPEAKEELGELEDEAEGEGGEGEEEGEEEIPKGKPKTKGKPKEKEEVPESDPKPPSRSRYFGAK